MLFLEPPYTSFTEPLDQINAVLHTYYEQEISDFLDSPISRESSLTIVAKICGICLQWSVDCKRRILEAMETAGTNTPTKQNK